MADRTGPVKPPVIDLTARAGSGGGRAESETATDTERPATADGTPWRDTLAAANWPLLAIAIAGGAVLGTLLTYLLAFALPLPSHDAPAPDPTPQLSAQADRIATLESDLAALRKTASGTQVSLDATITQLDTGLGELRQSLADLEAKMPAAVDLTPLQNELHTLKAQLDALAAGAPGTDAGAIATSLATLETTVNTLSGRLDGLDDSTGTLRTDLDALRQDLSKHIDAALPDEVGPAVKLPLILGGLESAFASGRPFADELTGLEAVLPDFTVPATLTAAAPTGLVRPDTLARRFEAVLPDIIAAAAGGGSGDWAQNAMDWGRSLLALRPAEEREGDSPDAVVSRLEGAMNRRDYAAAATLLGQLPAPMQQAAATVAADITAHADADALVAELRRRALESATTPG